MTSSMPEPETFPVKPRSTRKKWYAVIIVLILILSSFAILSILHPSRPEPGISIDTAPNYISAGNDYTITLATNETYKNITIEWGDNSQNTYAYSGNTLTASHIYENPGIYYITYWGNFSSGIYKSSTYIPVYVQELSISNSTAEGIISVINSSMNPVVSNSNIYSPGTDLNISIGNISFPANSTFKIVNQTVSIYHNGSIVSRVSSPSIFTLHLSSGYYVLTLSTVTGNGTKNYTTYYYMDIPVTKSAKLYINTVSDSIVYGSTDAYTNLNPQEAYTSGDLEILYNTEEFLIGNGTSGYFPEIASSLPKPDGKSYTFNISNNVRFQNGIPVNAYDVYYSLVMDLLLENESPQTPGWILAQYLLPGDYHNTNNYTNIMKAITYSNKSQTVTLNFTVDLEKDQVCSLLSSPGTFITSASYLSSNGENLTFTQAGFNYFKARKSSYTMTDVLSDGPYEIDKSMPGRYITLIRNPYFKGSVHNSVPSLDSVTISYTSSYSKIYQDMRFNTSQVAIFPSSYPYISSVSGISSYGPEYSLSTIYNFNANVDKSLLGQFYTYANLPSNLFSNITVREAFYEAYPGHNLTLAHQLWNSFITNTTEYARYGINGTSQYKNNPLVIPIFTEYGISGSNISAFQANLKGMIGNGSSFPIVTETESFMDTYMSAGINPMPIYEETLPQMNSSIYYSYLGNSENFTHLSSNGFNYYLFNNTYKNQSILMYELNSNISKLVNNFNSTNLGAVKNLTNNLYMYIYPSPGKVEMKVYYQSYVSMGNSVNGQGIIFFNNISD